MRIVHYHSGIRLAQGGVVRAVLDLASGLAARGHDVVLLTPDDADVPAEWRTPGPGRPRAVRTPAASRIPGRVAPAMRPAVAEALDGADALHLHGMWAPANVGLARMAVAAGVPYVVSVHGMLDDWSLSIRPTKKALFMHLAGRRMLREAAAVHCCAEGELRQAGPRLPRANGVVVPLLIDLSPFAVLPSPAGDDRDGPRLVFLSRLHPVKGLEIALDAVARIASRHPGLELVVAGSGDPDYERSLREHARRLGVEERCRFAGFVGGADKVSVLAEADLFVLPTKHENFGFVLLESIAAATPVLTTSEANTAPEILAAGAGRVAARSADAFAEALDELLGDRSRLRAMGERGRAWVMDAFGGDRGVERFEALYAGLGRDAGG